MISCCGVNGLVHASKDIKYWPTWSVDILVVAYSISPTPSIAFFWEAMKTWFGNGGRAVVRLEYLSLANTLNCTMVGYPTLQ
jgi:voltage-gated potassium channel Kch